MRTVTMSEAIEHYPNMLTVLRCVASKIRDTTTRVLMVPDAWDAFAIYVDGPFTSRELNSYYMDVVPESLWMNCDVGCSMIRSLNDAKVFTDAVDVTDVAKEVMHETQL